MQGKRRIYFTALHRGGAGATMGSDLIQTVLTTPEYERWRSDRIAFRFARVLTYQVGGAFAFGGGTPMWAECLFDFDITDEQKAVLMLRDDVRFAVDLAEYENAFETGCGWERPDATQSA